MSYISRVPKELQRQGRAPNSAKRSEEELRQGVKEWVRTKFEKPKKLALMRQLSPNQWTRELVVNIVKSEEEVALIESEGVTILRLKDILLELERKDFIIKSASGADFVDLISMGTRNV